MSMNKITRKIFVVAAVLFLASCTMNNKSKILEMDESQVALRQIQSRVFSTTDQPKTLRTVIATMQDLGFIVDKADQELGTVSGTKLNGYALRLSVSVRPRGQTQTIVRANASYQNTTVTDPEPYQDFFVSLEKAMFLTAQQVD